ncbi:MAG: hypothetical protein KDD53_08120, partial [Bdellovibrionales bacterium]|nr:hypothetical protein [Bdellovibrionales bacterium]
DTMKEIERWEMLGKTTIGEPLNLFFRAVLTKQLTEEIGVKASAMFHERTQQLEDHLTKQEWLVGNSMTAADVTIASTVFYSMLAPEYIALAPLLQPFGEMLNLGEGRDKTRSWVSRVIALDTLP